MFRIIKKIIRSFFYFFNYEITKISNEISFPTEIDEANKKLIEECMPFSMTGPKRMIALNFCLKNILDNKVDGDFVECGVWRGGNLILVQKIFNKHFSNKSIYGYDTFEGMSEPTEFDVDHRNKLAKTLLEKSNKKNDTLNIWAYVNKETVIKNINQNLSNNKIKLIKGKVEQTLKINENLPKKISILRLDTDWYESTKIELEILYPLLERNGFLIIDDYGHFKGARKAVDEYFGKFEKKPYLHIVDYSCRIIQKH